MALFASCAARQPAAVTPPPPAPAPVDAGLPFVRYAPAELATVKNVHRHRGLPVCQACHAHQTASLLAGPTHTCERCHADSRHSEGHEAGTRLPPERVKGLPMVNGVVVCHTCHDPHDLQRFRHGLRRPVNEVCLGCHANH